MKSAIITGFKAFIQQAKQNHYDYCKKVVEKTENQNNKKENK